MFIYIFLLVTELAVLRDMFETVASVYGPKVYVTVCSNDLIRHMIDLDKNRKSLGVHIFNNFPTYSETCTM